MTSAGQTLEGAIAIGDPAGRPAVSGTLAAETLALSRCSDRRNVCSTRRADGARSRSRSLRCGPSTSTCVCRRPHLDVYGRQLTDAAASVMVTQEASSA